MADVTITNLTTSPVYLRDLYTSVPASKSITVSRAASDLSRMSGLQAAVAAGTVAVSVVLNAVEQASGLAVIPGTVEAQDMAPVAAAAAAAGDIEIRKAFAAGGAVGTADDVAIYAVNTLPFKMRVLDAYAIISTASAGANHVITIRDQAAGAGNVAGVIDSAATGRYAVSFASNTVANTSTVLTPGASVGLFLHREDRDAAGEVVIKVRRES